MNPNPLRRYRTLLWESTWLPLILLAAFFAVGLLGLLLPAVR